MRLKNPLGARQNPALRPFHIDLDKVRRSGILREDLVVERHCLHYDITAWPACDVREMARRVISATAKGFGPRPLRNSRLNYIHIGEIIQSDIRANLVHVLRQRFERVYMPDLAYQSGHQKSVHPVIGAEVVSS